jgi:ferrochelatase
MKKFKKMKNKKQKKIAVVLFNLGGPDSKNAIRPFLMNFFMDKNIIRVPIPFRCIIAWLISSRRSEREAGESYGELKNKSPLLDNTKAQAKALEKALKADKTNQYKTFVCMRYWHPMSPQVVREVRDWDADEIIIVPLYPQFSTTTTGSSLQVWNKAMFEAGYDRPTSTICCYPWDEGFINASADNIQKKIKQAEKDGHDNIRVLMSAHGLPKSVIKDGDPYQWQCERTALAIADKLHLKTDDWAICYQSRVGPQKWIGPSLDEELERAAKDNKSVIIYPHAFTQEHVETLVELDIEYHEMAGELGIKGYYRADTVATHPDFINGLKDMVLGHTGSYSIQSNEEERLCPKEFSKCCMNKI